MPRRFPHPRDRSSRRAVPAGPRPAGAPPGSAPPLFVPPQLATPASQAPTGDAWIHEIKLDGYRMACRIAGDDVRFLSRRELDWTADLPELAWAAARPLPTHAMATTWRKHMVRVEVRRALQALAADPADG